MQSPKWDDPDPGFLTVSYDFCSNPYQRVAYAPQQQIGAAFSAFDPSLYHFGAELELNPVIGTGSEHDDQFEDGSEHELETEQALEPEFGSSAQEVKQEITWSMIEAGLQAFASANQSDSSSANGYAQFSDTANTTDNVQSSHYPLGMTWNSQSSLPEAEEVTMANDGHIVTQITGGNSTDCHFSVFSTADQIQPQQPSYDSDSFDTSATASFGTAASDSASFGGSSYDATPVVTAPLISPYDGSFYGTVVWGLPGSATNSYEHACMSNPYTITPHNHASVEGMNAAQVEVGYAQGHYSYDEASQMSVSASSIPVSTMPASNMPAMTSTAPSMATSSDGSMIADSSLVPAYLRHANPPGPAPRVDRRGRHGTTFYRYVTPPFQVPGKSRYVVGDEKPVAMTVESKQPAEQVSDISNDSDSGSSRASFVSPRSTRTSRASSSASNSSPASSSGDYNRQEVLDSIPLLKLYSMRTVPIPAKNDNLARDRYIVRGKQLQLSYRQIKAVAGWTDAESTLRGRHRNFTKSREQRVRKPVWHEVDKFLLIQVVLGFAEDNLRRKGPIKDANNITIYRPAKRYRLENLPLGAEAGIAWKDVAIRMKEIGATYEFGSCTTKRKWFEVTKRKRMF